MLSECFITSTRTPQTPKNTLISKDVGIYLHELQPNSTIKSSYKKSSAPVNALAVSSTHIFAAQADKAVVHVYSRDRGNQEALISFPERISSLTLIGDGIVVLGTAEGRVILWEVCVCVCRKLSSADIYRSVLDDKSRLLQLMSKQSPVLSRLNHI